MPLYMDRHEPSPDNTITAKDLAEAHMRDLEIQSKYNVNYLSYWFDPKDQTVFCLADAPTREAAETVHRESHGLMPSQVIEVDPFRLKEFFGEIVEPAPGSPHTASALRTIVFTDMAGSTEMTQRLGDDKAMEILRAHDAVMKQCLADARGRQIKHTGDGLMACFTSVVNALECASQMQQKLDGFTVDGGEPLRIRVGIAAGEPVTENDDLFGAAVQLAARICAKAPDGGILTSSAVRDLAIGKRFDWEFHGEHELKGFTEPFRLFRLLWNN